MSQDRREFLGTLLAAGVAPELVRQSAGPSDAEGFAAADLLHHRRGAKRAEEWDLSWVGRLTGSHRAVFDWPQPNASAGLWRAGIWKKQVVEHLGAKPEEVSVVLVIRHGAIPMIMGDEFWERHQLGKTRKLKDPFTNKTAARNPYRRFEGRNQGSSIEGFLQSGGIVLACGFAFGFMVSLEAKLQNKPAAEVRPQVLAEVIPGIVIQPSGFFALLEAQRNGCGLFPADLE